MTGPWLDLNPFPLALFVVLIVLMLIHMVWYLGLFIRLIRFRPAVRPVKQEGVSVVVCAHNESRNLRENLPAILEQDYPEYEVLVVDHASDDDTPFILKDLSIRFPNLKSITIREDLNFFSGKKFPLAIGIRSARYATVLLTDADCHPASSSWIRLMREAMTDDKEIVLGYSPYAHGKGLLNHLIRFDTVHIAIQYLAYALGGIPYMGVGRNLSYRKELFLRNKGFIQHYQIRSGDDDLFINRVATRRNTTVVLEPGAYTVSEPKRDFGHWVTQKRRHLSTGNHYRLFHRLLLGIYGINPFIFYTIAVVMMALNISLLPVAGLILLRWITQYLIFAGCLRRLGERDLVWFVPFYEIILLFLNGGIMFSNFFIKPKRWK